MEGHSPHIFSLSPITAAFIFIVLVSAGLLIYQFIILAWCRRREIILITRHHQELPSRTSFQDPASSSSLENSITSLIPPCKYTRDVGLVSKSEDVTCAVCLSEFKDGEPVRVLPECLHTFHVPCIDMWLYSHSNCPICRAHTGVSTPVHHRQSQYNTTMRLPDFSGLRSAL